MVSPAAAGQLYHCVTSHNRKRSAEIAHRPPAPVPLPALFALPAEWRGGSRLLHSHSPGSHRVRDFVQQAAIRNISLQKLA